MTNKERRDAGLAYIADESILGGTAGMQEDFAKTEFHGPF